MTGAEGLTEVVIWRNTPFPALYWLEIADERTDVKKTAVTPFLWRDISGLCFERLLQFSRASEISPRPSYVLGMWEEKNCGRPRKQAFFFDWAVFTKREIDSSHSYYWRFGFPFHTDQPIL